MTESDIISEQGLIFEDILPLKWQTADSEILSADMTKFDTINEEVLSFIDVLDEHPSDYAGDYSSTTNQESVLSKVDVKFDLLLSLVTQLLGVYFPLPDPVKMKLTPYSVQWISRVEINPETQGLVEIYLSSRCPRSLVFPAKIESAEQVGQTYRISARFGAIGAPIRERLEKLIFRHHRRGVAQARRRLASESNIPNP